MEDKPNYFAIIPANVRYDTELKANEKLLYGEITSLMNKEGYCTAGNKYFAELYNVSVQSISYWIKNLIDKGYLESELVYNDNSKEIQYRKLTTPLLKKSLIPIKENFKGNNINNNINTYLLNNNYQEREKEKEKEKEEIFSLFETTLGVINPSQYEKINFIIDNYSLDKIKEAVKISEDNSKRNLNYIMAILRNGVIQNKKVAPVPEWINKKIEYKRASDETIKELEEAFKEFM